MIAWQKGAQSDYSRRIVKKKLSKIAPLFEIQHDVLFRRISVQWMGSGYVYALTKEKRITRHTMHFPYNPIYFATFFFFLHCPQFTHPTHAPVKQSYKASIDRQINRLSRDIQHDEYKSRMKEIKIIIDRSRVALLFEGCIITTPLIYKMREK